MGFDKEFFDAFSIALKRYPGDWANHGILAFDEMSVRAAPAVNVRDMKFNGLIDLDARYKCDGPSSKNASSDFHDIHYLQNCDGELSKDLQNIDSLSNQDEAGSKVTDQGNFLKMF